MYLSKPLVTQYLPQLTGASSVSIMVEVLDDSSGSADGGGASSSGGGAVAGKLLQWECLACIVRLITFIVDGIV